MAKENQAQSAVINAKQAVESYLASFNASSIVKIELLSSVAALEVRAEQAKQQELANMIAMAANPAACPFPSADVLARIKELTNLG